MRAVPISRSLVFLLIACLGCFVDLYSKSIAFERLGMPGPSSPPHWVWDQVFGFQTSLNEGALFGLGQGLVPVFAGLSILAAVGIFLWLFYAGAAHDWLLTIALSCIMAGIFGNLYDRLGFPDLQWNADGIHEAGQKVYAVRDFILIKIGSYHWPNFNIADSLLVCGAFLLVGHSLWSHRQQEPLPANESSTTKSSSSGSSTSGSSSPSSDSEPTLGKE